MRLQKFMALCGVASRRNAEKMILDGKVTVNGRLITEMGVQVEEDDVVLVDGVRIFPETEKHYVIYHKPAGEVTTVNDPEGRPCVLDHFRDYPVRLYPVGRLDYDTEGLLLLTNDGALTKYLTHPSHDVEKQYLTRVVGDIRRAEAVLHAPMSLDGRPLKPFRFRVLKETDSSALLHFTISEGRNRQIRRMCEAAGLRVVRLRRIAEGKLQLGELPVGKWRFLTTEEISGLRQMLQ